MVPTGPGAHNSKCYYVNRVPLDIICHSDRIILDCSNILLNCSNILEHIGDVRRVPLNILSERGDIILKVLDISGQ